MTNPHRQWNARNQPTGAPGRGMGHRRHPVAVAVATLAVLIGVAQMSTAAAQGLPVLSSQAQAVIGGSVSSAGSRMTINQSSARMVANWQSFSVGAGNTVQFVQPSASAVALNRVVGADPSLIQGALKANGQVFLLNPNGVVFSPTAQVSVGSLVASTLSLPDDDFMAGRLRFSGDSTQAVVNRGQITAVGDGTRQAPGFVALLGARIVNDAGASISAPGGSVLLGAGQTVTLDIGGPVQLQIERGALDAQITNGGAIVASGGRILLNAQGADALSRSVINQTGFIDASSLQANEQGHISLLAEGGAMLHSGSAKANGVDGGRIDVHVGSLIDAGQWQATGSAGLGGAIDIHATRHLEQTASGAADASGAAGGGSVRVTAGESAWLSGRLDASSSGGVGGQVSATAATLTLAGAHLTADGAAGGGLVRVGGGWQGGDADLANATSTLLMPQTHL
ncbi:MAG TPA: filamentous hemagglutinin N-terminal domain-containing protein, partial [Ramlibacter sp.]|nr:filamentous hemagglutinin N-terminal domain-containing protein [Ramlibacter sp.]